MGNAHPSVYPYRTFPTIDRDVIIAAANDRQFRDLCEIVGSPELADDPRFSVNADRTANRDELYPLLVERVRTWTADDLFVALNRAGVPCGPINSIKEGIELADQLGLDPIVRLGEPTVGSIRNPITFASTPARYHLPPPARGEHTAEIAAWLRT